MTQPANKVPRSGPGRAHRRKVSGDVRATPRCGRCKEFIFDAEAWAFADGHWEHVACPWPDRFDDEDDDAGG